jgi:steroid delta-isomerase-like uncharacterized protein
LLARLGGRRFAFALDDWRRAMADVREVAKQFVDAFNGHDEDRMRELSSENAVMEAPGEVHIEGRDAVTEYGMAWLRAFPDARITVNNELADGNWVVQEFTFSGTHDDTLSSPNGDIPATHRKLNGRGIQVLRVDGDTIADTRLYFDQVQVMTQLGLMPAAVTT